LRTEIIDPMPTPVKRPRTRAELLEGLATVPATIDNLHREAARLEIKLREMLDLLLAGRAGAELLGTEALTDQTADEDGAVELLFGRGGS
jgi:hypothetical protein